MNSARTFPLRIEPVEGEGLDSWLEAVACRSRAPSRRSLRLWG